MNSQENLLKKVRDFAQELVEDTPCSGHGADAVRTTRKIGRRLQEIVGLDTVPVTAVSSDNLAFWKVRGCGHDRFLTCLVTGRFLEECSHVTGFVNNLEQAHFIVEMFGGRARIDQHPKLTHIVQVTVGVSDEHKSVLSRLYFGSIAMRSVLTGDLIKWAIDPVANRKLKPHGLDEVEAKGIEPSPSAPVEPRDLTPLAVTLSPRRFDIALGLKCIVSGERQETCLSLWGYVEGSADAATLDAICQGRARIKRPEGHKRFLVEIGVGDDNKPVLGRLNVGLVSSGGVLTPGLLKWAIDPDAAGAIKPAAFDWNGQKQ